MKPARSVIAAMGFAVACGLGAGLLATLVLLGTARSWVAIGATLATLATGFVTLLVKYPRWEADL